MATPAHVAALVQEARICLLASARIKDSADPADALLVLLSAPLSELHGSIFEPAKLADLVQGRFGWALSAEAIEYFIPKMRQLGWLQSQSGLPSRGPFVVNLPEPEADGGGNVDTREALIDLGSRFRRFAVGLSPFQSLPPEDLEAGAMLLRYAVDANLPFETENPKAKSDEAFLAARFIGHVNRRKLPEKDLIASLSAVGFLLRVAEEIGRPSQRRRADLRIVIDGPILLDYLGCSGPLRTQSTADILDRVRAMGASTVTFDHCVLEARDALRSVLRKPARDRYGPTGEALRKGLVHENVLLGLLQAFDMAVRSRGIEILPDDIEFTPQSHKFFDEKRTAGVESIVNWHDEDNENARYADSDTVVLTIRRRAGHRTSDLFSSKFVCVTTNETFAGATKRHLLETAYYNARQVPPVISLKELSAKLWFELGNADKAARLELPNSQLLLTCDRALRFNRKVVDRAKSELEKVRPEQIEQFELLLEVPRSARAVMDLTLNNEKYVSEETIDQLVEAAVAAAGAEVNEKARAQRAKDQERFRRELTAAEGRIEEERQRAEKERRRAEEQEHAASDARRQAGAVDADMLQALGESATGSFATVRKCVRTASVLVALVPVVGVALAAWRGEASPALLGLAVLVAALAAAAGMDRPGAWLSKIIHRILEGRCERQLRSVGRHDLASRLEFDWKEGVATAKLAASGNS